MKPTLIERSPPVALGCVLFLVVEQLIPHSFFGIGGFIAVSLVGVTTVGFSLVPDRGLEKKETSIHKPRRESRKITRRGGHARNGLHLPISLFLQIAAGFSITFAAKAALYSLDSRAYSGLTLSAVESVEVVLKEDPRARGKNGWIAEGVLQNVYAGGISTQGRGRILVFASESPVNIGAGRKLLLTGRMECAKERDAPFVFFADSWEPKEWSARVLSVRLAFLNETQAKLAACRPDTASFLSALLLGKKTDTGSPVMMRFETSGCMHLLALSGFHVGLIALAIRRILKPAGLVLSFLVSVAVSLIYLFLVGMRPSLIRAVVMFCLWAFDRSRGIRSRPICYLAFAFILQCFFFPQSTSTLAFRLSYAALAGMLSAGKAVLWIFTRIGMNRLGRIVGAGVGAHMSTMPFIIASFGMWRPVGVAAAPVLTPLVALSMGVGAVLLALPEQSTFFPMVVFCADTLVSVIGTTAKPFSFVQCLYVPLPIAWLVALGGGTIPLILLRRNENARSNPFKPRLPGLHPSLPGKPGYRPAETLGTEFSHQPRSTEKNYRSVGHRSGYADLGNRTRLRRHERINFGLRGETDGLRN